MAGDNTVCRVYLVRHGVTEWNQSLRYQGQTDIPLCDYGRRQAARLAARLAGRLKVDAFYTSDLSRAAETAAIVAAPHGLAAKPQAAFREMNFGRWEGLTAVEVRERFPAVYRDWLDHPLGVRPPDGETYAEVAERTRRGLAEVVVSHPGRNVVVVAHGGAIRCIIGTALGMDLNLFWKLRTDNASLSIVDYPEPDRGILLLFNDVSHLPADLPPVPANPSGGA
ncbi:MAG: histidine phosphatase family protein [Peptococcaceae bacterium]|nr:histidine phosphatase family protein [Peptococcaceae bacterium]